MSNLKALTEDKVLREVVEKICEQVWSANKYGRTGLSPPENWNEIYGDAFKWTPQEKMIIQQLKEKNT